MEHPEKRNVKLATCNVLPDIEKKSYPNEEKVMRKVSTHLGLP